MKSEAAANKGKPAAAQAMSMLRPHAARLVLPLGHFGRLCAARTAPHPSMPSRPTTVIIVPVMVAMSFASPSAAKA